MRLLTMLMPLVVGCSDYSFKPAPEPNLDDTGAPGDGGTVTGDGGSTPTDTCSERTHPADTLELNPDCYVEASVGTFNPVLKWRKTSWSADPTSNNVMMAPIVVSLNDDNGDGLINQDDVPDIVVITYASSYGTLRAMSGADGSELWNVVGQQLQLTGAVAAGDIDGDGIVEIIAPTSNQLKAFENDGSLKWTSASLAGHMYGTSDAPAIADLDGDGSPEVLVGKAILRADGTTRATGSQGMAGVSGNVGTVVTAADLDGDGTQEVVVGNAAYRPDGTSVFSNGQPDGYVAVADFDLDGQAEIVVVNSGVVRVQSNTGTVIWTATVSGASSGYGGPPTVADFDGDGYPEVGVAARSNYTVFDTDGRKLWERTTQDASSGNTGSAVFDFEGDGVAEAVYADETKLWVFDGPDGRVKLESTEHSNATWTEYPTIADVDADGHAEIVVANTNYTTGHTGIYVFGDRDNTWRSGRKIWNQHSYSITNINDDGTIPARPDLNWLSYNNFRSGDMAAGQGGEYADLIVQITDVCTKDCDDDLLVVWVQVGNQGYLPVDGSVDLALFGMKEGGGREVLHRSTLTGLESGVLGQSIQLVVDLTEFPGMVFEDLTATIDGGNSSRASVVEECDETNNEDTWGENLCWD